jgi:hypothetical protein
MATYMVYRYLQDTTMRIRVSFDNCCILGCLVFFFLPVLLQFFHPLKHRGLRTNVHNEVVMQKQTPQVDIHIAPCNASPGLIPQSRPSSAGFESYDSIETPSDRYSAHLQDHNDSATDPKLNARVECSFLHCAIPSHSHSRVTANNIVSYSPFVVRIVSSTSNFRAASFAGRKIE